MAILINSYHPGAVELVSNSDLVSANDLTSPFLKDTTVNSSSTGNSATTGNLNPSSTGNSASIGNLNSPSTGISTSIVNTNSSSGIPSSSVINNSSTLVNAISAQNSLGTGVFNFGSITSNLNQTPSTLGHKRGPPSPAYSPATIRPRTGAFYNGNDQIIYQQQTLIQEQSSEILSLREEIKTLSKQMSSLTSLVQQIVPGIAVSENATPQVLSTEIESGTNQASPQATNSTAPKAVRSTSAATGRKTYAEIAQSRGITGDQQISAVKALQDLCKRPRVRPTLSNLQKIYVQGISRQPIKKLKSILQAVRIRTSAIPSISFVGLQTVEFLVTSDYANGFKKAIKQLSPVENRFRILECYDASTASDPTASPELKNKLQAAFVTRLHGIIKNNTNQTAQDYFKDWLQRLNLPLPEPQLADAGDAMEEEESIQEEVESVAEVIETPPLNPTFNNQQAPGLNL